jgi:outer membrane protein assembly factor BamB
MGLFSKGLSRNVKWEFSPKGRIFTIPAIADTNGDGILEVIFGCDDHSLYVLRGSDGSIAWSFETDGPVRSSPIVADVNGDGVKEIVFGSDDSNVYCLNGVDGRVLWALKCDGPIRSPPAVGDIDGDGHPEVVVTGDDSSAYAIDGRGGELIWQSSHRGAKSGALNHSAPCLVDLEGDGELKIVTGSAGNTILIYGTDGSLKSRREFEAPSFNTSVAAGDINRDGRMEIVACSDNGAIYAMGADGDVLWSRVLGVAIRSSPVLSDLNGDGRMEILIHVSQEPTGGNKLLCLGSGGELLWEKVLKGDDLAVPVPVDIDHDGGVEVIVFSKEGISILSDDGEEVKTIGAPGQAFGGTQISDVDGDAEFEFIYASVDGRILCVSSHMGSRQCEVLAGSARAGRHNTGVYMTTPQKIEELKQEARKLKELGGAPSTAYQNLIKVEREQGMRDLSNDLERIEDSLARARAQLNRQRKRAEFLQSIKGKMKTFSSLDLDGASQLSLTVARIERMMDEGKDAGAELESAREMVEVLEEKSKEKLDAINAKRLSFLVGQFLEKFADPTESDIDGFIRYLESEDLPFLPYEIKKAIETRRHERKFQSLRDSGRFDFMSEEEKVIAIGSSLAESIIHDIMNVIGVPVGRIQQRVDDVYADYPNVPRLVVSENGKLLTDELRKTLRDMPEQKVISAAVSLFCVYITKLFDFYQELTDFETSYSRFKTSMDYLNRSFGAQEIVQQFQERACHGIFAEEVRVKRILDL